MQYSYYGQGSLFFKIQVTLTSLLSQLSLCILFMSLAYGYGTLQQYVGLNDLRIHRSLIIGALVAHLLIAFLILTDHEERHKWHDYQGP